MDKISILLPTYNVENYIAEALESLVNQTYKNIEIIIVDDCSKDNTFKIIESYHKKDKRIKVFRNLENKKICYSLNKAFENCTGNYILRVDGDDVCDLNRIEVMHKYIKSNNYDLIGTSTITINEKGQILGKNRVLNNKNLLKIALKITNPMCHIWLSKREVYEKLRGYREIPYAEDYDFILRCIEQGFKIFNLSDYYGYRVRRREGNTVTSVGILQSKAVDYVKKMSNERRKNNKDNFSKENFNFFIKSNKNEIARYNNANYLFNKAFELKREQELKWVYYFLKSLIISKSYSIGVFRRIFIKIIGIFDMKICS